VRSTLATPQHRRAAEQTLVPTAVAEEASTGRPRSSLMVGLMGARCPHLLEPPQHNALRYADATASMVPAEMIAALAPESKQVRWRPEHADATVPSKGA
jgi:hypothetical protein